ncbi:thiamine biosynthesis protein [Fimicolochytrium jonesii]|uniref:thiamine biosynthesis protein n=1 Tax=Fimicolochytrium jonesii TaxID=1396493 RepID=UPI0022FF2196|nr:thiamine biosynthesis protein [Fimicolochytrium jonesii]KAI8815573.1 thiamine biosynthesis protein [Fimicolochytrium jonesii]
MGEVGHIKASYGACPPTSPEKHPPTHFLSSQPYKNLKMATTDKITVLLNWAANAYHIPLYLAQKKGYFADEGIKVALLEPSDPSDVTEIIGSGKIDMGCKAMIHTIAAKARGFNVTSIGTLLDEPFTGVIYLKSRGGVTEDFKSLKGKRIGYVGEFGKIIIDELTSHHGMAPADYTAVRVGMNVADAIKRGVIDAGVGLENIQMVELEEWSVAQGRSKDDVAMLRIDELAELGCCCFCSVLYIANDTFLQNNGPQVSAFMRAVKRATDDVRLRPEESWAEYITMKPNLGDEVNKKMFDRSLVYFSASLKNVQRDWNKVTNYSKRLGVVDASFKQNMTNEYIPASAELLQATKEEARIDAANAAAEACMSCEGAKQPRVEVVSR